MEIKKVKKVGLFWACYEIGGQMPGAPLFKVNLGVYTPEEKVSGMGQITQTTNPPLDIPTHLVGEYSYMCVMPQNCHIFVKLTGFSIMPVPPPDGGMANITMPNVQLKMFLDGDWQKGVATYKYRDDKGNWHEIENAPVKACVKNCITDAEE